MMQRENQASAIFKNSNEGMLSRNQSLRDYNPSEPSMMSQEESTSKQRNRNLEFQRAFVEKNNLNQEQSQLLLDVIEGKISRKDIAGYQESNPQLRGLYDRTFVGANSAISFEELSASEKAGSVRSGQNNSHFNANQSAASSGVANQMRP